MVYVEYNTSKREKTEYGIDVVESLSHEGYTYLPFAPLTIVHPNSTLYPIADLTTENNEYGYLLRFVANKSYPYGNYYFEYDNKYYLFTTQIRKGTKIYFSIEEDLPEGETEWQEVPFLTAESYYQSKEILPVYDTLELNKSGNELTFSNVKADFGIRTMEQLPMAFQEIRIWQGELKGNDDLSECELKYTGFLDKAELTQKHTDEDECDIEFTLLSPMNLTTKRYVSVSGTYKTDELFNLIFEPLINDGFNLEKINMDNRTISVNYYLETIETIMNDLSNKLNIFWNIDSQKNIHINDIIKLLGQEPKMIITSEKTEGLYEMKPIIENNGYFNTINVKNARIYTSGTNQQILEVMKLISEETQTFVNPIDFGSNGASRVCLNNNTTNCTILSITDENGQILYEITYDVDNKDIVLPSGVVYNDGDTENATLILERDSFFKNLITGMQWKGTTQNIRTIESDTMLKYQLFRVTNSNEIYKCSQFLTDSGIIEKTIDVNESWFTYTELVEYCSNLITSNANNTAKVELSFDKDYGLEIGDKIRINRPAFFINGDFVITEINETQSHYDYYNCQIVAQNNKLQANYIDIFRKDVMCYANRKFHRQ